MPGLQEPSIFKIPLFTCFRHEVVSTFSTSYWKLLTGKEFFIPYIYLYFQNNPLDILDEKKLSLLLILNLSFNVKLLIS